MPLLPPFLYRRCVLVSSQGGKLRIKPDFDFLHKDPSDLAKKEYNRIDNVFYSHSKYPHFNSAYLLRIPFSSGIAVFLEWIKVPKILNFH